MTIKPCSRCPIKVGCEKRLGLLKSVKGLHLSSIKFQCDLLKGHLIPGMWCEARFDYVHNDDNGQVEEAVLMACVARIRVDGKAVVWIPPNETKWLQAMKNPEEKDRIEWLAVWPDRLKPLPEVANEPHCEKCGTPHEAIGKNAGCRLCCPENYESGDSKW